MENNDDGWNNYYSTSNSSGMRCGNMKCHKCKKSIRGNYLIQDRSNNRHRGNETDERYLYHRKCSSDNNVWKVLDIEQKQAKYNEKLRREHIKEVSTLIEKYELDVDDLFDIEYNQY